MKHEVEENLERKIKKHIYGKSQTVKVIFPPGFGATALEEIKHLAMFEQHWITYHPEEGPFPFGTFPINSDINHPCPYFPSLDEVHQKMEAL